MPKRHFLQLAHSLKPKHNIRSAYVSEKLDGIRFIWIPESRGVPVEDVPWANITKSNAVPIATGLWSRYGKVINAPDYWLDRMPPFIVDGELWSGRGEFQRISSIVRANVNVKTEDWQEIIAVVFDVPNPNLIFDPDGKIDEAHYKCDMSGALDWWQQRGGEEVLSRGATFQTRYNFLQRNMPDFETFTLKLHDQRKLSGNIQKASFELDLLTDDWVSEGAEGSMIRLENDFWLPFRCHTLLKYKPYLDAEAEVVGYTWGRETDKGSKLLGLMGALICKIPAGTFKLSGFTDAEREMVGSYDPSVPVLNEGKEVVCGAYAKHFPLGSTITYKYRELTDDGLPKEARYLRHA